MRRIVVTKRYYLYFLLSLLAIILPVFLTALDTPLIASTYSKDYQIFELFGFCESLSLITILAIEIKRRRIATLKRALIVILPILIAFFFLTFIVEFSQKPYDYRGYEHGAKAILEGSNPYLSHGEPEYLYPPLLATSMSLAYRSIGWVLRGLEMHEEGIFIWRILYYFYQCLQLLFIILAYQLCVHLSVLMKIPRWAGVGLVAALFVFNNPLIRTLKHGQVNMYILDTILLSIIFFQQRPFLSGIMAALGGHIKLYPFLLGLPMLLLKNWKAVLGLIVGTGCIAFGLADFGRSWTPWYQFFSYLLNVQRPVLFRNNSLYSLTFNLGRFLDFPLFIRDNLVSILYISILVWFGLRYFSRMKTTDVNASLGQSMRSQLIFGNLMDSVAMMLLISPSVWEHQYVMALPLSIWAVAAQGRSRPWLVGTGIFLMFALPTFDVFPISYHRILGLLILVWVTSPRIADLQMKSHLI